MIANLLKYTALGLVLIASILAEPGDRIPNHPNCTDPQDGNPVYFVHPTNCSRFYECKGRDAWELECPAGLHFNSKIDVCDFPANAQCDGQSATGSPTVPTASNPTTTEQELTSTTTVQTSTTSYPVTSTTQEAVTTNDPTTPTFPVTSTTQETVTTNDPTPPTYPVTTTTQETVTTNNPTTTEDLTTSTSEPPTTETSYPDTTSDSVTATTSNPNCPPLGSAQPNYYPHSTDCNKYMACQENCVQHFECPAGLYWNNLQKRCDVFANSQCACPIIPPAPNVWT